MQIDFYLLQRYDSYQHFICRLLEKAYQQHYRCYLYCQNPAQAQQLDNLLWIYKDISFLPHAPYMVDDLITPIQIAHPEITAPTWTDKTQRLLINLNPNTPEFFLQFERIAEVITQWDSTQLEQGRARYRHYVSLNYQLNPPHIIH